MKKDSDKARRNESKRLRKVLEATGRKCEYCSKLYYPTRSDSNRQFVKRHFCNAHCSLLYRKKMPFKSNHPPTKPWPTSIPLDTWGGGSIDMVKIINRDTNY